MKFGLFGGALAGSGSSNDSNDYAYFNDYICQADDLGFHSAFVVEHHFTGIGQVSSTLNLLSYLAAKTKTIRLGTGVTVLPWHNPVLLAEQIATLDLLSEGRADIGVGKGYRPYEFNGFAIDQKEAAGRYEECLDLLIRSWTTRERFSHSGKYWTFNDIVVEPAPTQKPHPPIWVGATSQPSIEKAARQGFQLLLDMWAPAAVAVDRVRAYEAARTAAGLKIAPHQVGLCRAVTITQSSAETEAALVARTQMVLDSGALKSGAFALPAGFDEVTPESARVFTEQAATIGRPDEVIAKLRDLQSNGVSYVLLADTACSGEALETFAREIMPAFSQPAQAQAA